MFELIARAGENAVAIAKATEQRFRDYPSPTVTQDDVKELEHEGDRIVVETLHCINAQFVTPYDREDLVALAFAVDEVPDKIENASELLGLYGVQTPTRQSIALCELLVECHQPASRSGSPSRSNSPGRCGKPVMPTMSSPAIAKTMKP